MRSLVAALLLCLAFMSGAEAKRHHAGQYPIQPSMQVDRHAVGGWSYEAAQSGAASSRHVRSAKRHHRHAVRHVAHARKSQDRVAQDAPAPKPPVQVASLGDDEIAAPQQATPAPTALLDLAQRSIGQGPKALGLHRFSLWCATAINHWLGVLGIRGTGSDTAASFAHWGKPTEPTPGAVAIKSRRGGNHVVIVKSVLPGGKLLTISPNGGGNRVRETVYRARVFYAFRMPPA